MSLAPVARPDSSNTGEPAVILRGDRSERKQRVRLNQLD